MRLSLYQFNDELEMRDAGYEYKYQNTPAISWSEEDSPQWKFLGVDKLFEEGKHCATFFDHLFA